MVYDAACTTAAGGAAATTAAAALARADAAAAAAAGVVARTRSRALHGVLVLCGKENVILVFEYVL